MERQEKILFIIQAIEQIEGVRLQPEYFSEYSDGQIDDEVGLDGILTHEIKCFTGTFNEKRRRFL